MTRTMFPKLWDPSLNGHFRGFSAFQYACSHGSLPSYSFIEPSFLIDPNDEHPPHDVTAGEAFLFDIWEAVSQLAGFGIKTLLVITFDEHGGCYDHVLPPTNAVDPAIRPATRGRRDSPSIASASAFRRSSSPRTSRRGRSSGPECRTGPATPYDHTSILATLRDWLSIPGEPHAAEPANRRGAPPGGDPHAGPRPASRHPHDRPARHSTGGLVNRSLNRHCRSIDLAEELESSGAARRFGMDPAAALLVHEDNARMPCHFFSPRAIRGCVGDLKAASRRPLRCGSGRTHPPDLPFAAKIASIASMFRIASSIGVGTGESSRIASARRRSCPGWCTGRRSRPRSARSPRSLSGPGSHPGDAIPAR